MIAPAREPLPIQIVDGDAPISDEAVEAVAYLLWSTIDAEKDDGLEALR